jgi:hypothetical protein
MCKMLFIGIKERLDEIPINKEYPGIIVKAIEGEFMSVACKFNHRNIYFVATSRGCSCDFGIEKKFKPYEFSEQKIEQKIRMEKSILSPIRDLLGIQEKYIKNKIEETRKLVEQEQSYFDQTLHLIEILKANTTGLNFTELYCCWAGEYSGPIDQYRTINISAEKFEEYFEIELREKLKFVQQ